MRAALITSGLGLGGSERQLVLNARQLSRVGVTPHVILLNADQNDLVAPLEEHGVAVTTLPPTVRGFARRLTAVARLLRALRPTVVHSWVFHANPYAGLAGRWAGAPVRIGSQRNVYQSVRNRLSRPERWLALHTVRPFVVNSQQAYDELMALGRRPRELLLLPNVVELPDLAQPTPFPADLAALGLTPAAPLIVTVGNLRRQKNQARFVRALAAVLPDFPQAHGLIIGRPLWNEPDVAEELRMQIAATGSADRIHLLGGRPDAAQLLPHAAVFCLTSDYEGTPNVVMEALAAGLPVLATRVGGVPDLIADGVSGFLIEPDAEADLAEQLRQLLAQPALRARMGAAARRQAEARWGGAAAGEQLAAFYRRLAAERLNET